MKARFDFTIDDLIDGAERGLKRSPLVHSGRWRAALTTSVLSAVLIYLLVPGSPEMRLGLAIVCATVTALAYPTLLAQARKARLRKLFLERFGGPGPFPFEIELTPEAVITTQGGTQSRHEWSKFTSVEDTADAIELVARGVGTIVVRNRAFGSKEEWRAFLDTARNYLAERHS